MHCTVEMISATILLHNRPNVNFVTNGVVIGREGLRLSATCAWLVPHVWDAKFGIAIEKPVRSEIPIPKSAILFSCRLWPFRAVLGTSLLAISDAYRIECPANDVITHSRQVLHAASTNQHNRVLL